MSVPRLDFITIVVFFLLVTRISSNAVVSPVGITPYNSCNSYNKTDFPPQMDGFRLTLLSV